PRLDLGRGDWKPDDLLALPSQDNMRVRVAPPLSRVGADDQRAGLFREAPEDRGTVALGDRHRPRLDARRISSDGSTGQGSPTARMNAIGMSQRSAGAPGRTRGLSIRQRRRSRMV